MRPDIADKWMLHHNNAPCHTALSVTEFLPQKAFLWFPSPFSPDLSPRDFFLLPKLKNVLKGRHFGTLEKIQESVMDMLKTTPVEDFQRCYQKREQRLHRCVAGQGNCFEGDNVDVWNKIKTLVNKKSVIIFLLHLEYLSKLEMKHLTVQVLNHDLLYHVRY